MDNALILVIDDSPTIRKMVECHLSQAGYRVALAADAERGLEMAAMIGPSLILLDHQLPGTTGDEVCRRLLESDATAKVPVVISSAMRNRAFVRYSEFPNVVDQIPKPFTPEVLKSGVANALQMGAMVVQAQRTGSAMPESVGEVRDAALEGTTAAFPLRVVLDFLNNGQQTGQLSLEMGKDRLKFALGAGRIQGVVAATIGPDRLGDLLPADLADLAPLLSITLGEHQDASMSGLVKMLERSLSDPRRLRALLRTQAAVLTYWALNGEPGKFAFEPHAVGSPMVQAFPLQLSVPALAIEGVKRCDPSSEPTRWGHLVFARQAPRGGNLDRAGLSAVELKIHALLDGTLDLDAVAGKVGQDVSVVADVARGLELTGLVERRSPSTRASILVLEDDTETVRTVQRVLGSEGDGYQLKVVRDRVGAQLLLRRNQFEVIIMSFDRIEQEHFYQVAKEQAPSTTRFVGIVGIDDESELTRLDALGLDGVLRRPVSETDLTATVKHLLRAGSLAEVS